MNGSLTGPSGTLPVRLPPGAFPRSLRLEAIMFSRGFWTRGHMRGPSELLWKQGPEPKPHHCKLQQLKRGSAQTPQQLAILRSSIPKTLPVFETVYLNMILITSLGLCAIPQHPLKSRPEWPASCHFHFHVA